MRSVFLGVALLLSSSLLFSACDSLTGGGARKVVVNESVCSGIDLLRMKLGQETKIVLDNTDHGATQESIALSLTNFPVIVIGELPPNTSVGTNSTTVEISALAGETDSVTVKPIFTGDFIAFCNVSLRQGSGGQVLQRRVTFQIIE